MTQHLAVEPASRDVVVNGIRLRYWEWEGGGPTLVLLHSSGSFGRVWDWVAAELAPSYRLLAPDQRGHGDSDEGRGNAAEDYAADLEALAAQLGLGRFALVGHSLGGRVGIVYAAQHPERVSHLVLAGGPHYASLVPGSDVEHWRQSAERMRNRPKRVGSVDEARAALRAAAPQLGDAAIEQQLRFSMREAADGTLEWKANGDWVAGGLDHALDDLSGYAKRIECPVLIVRAGKSWELTPERMPTVQAMFPTSRTVTLEGAVNNLQLEKPRELAAAIRESLASP
jgi:pimeloyl-ACP methyl ester carboxylesterase